jgi:hypothetical protein
MLGILGYCQFCFGDSERETSKKIMMVIQERPPQLCQLVEKTPSKYSYLRIIMIVSYTIVTIVINQLS